VSISLSLSVCGMALSACVASQDLPAYQPRPGQGQYIRPAYMNPVPTPRIPEPDVCNSQFYRSLVGQHEGALYVAGLPGRKRVIKPAFTEELEPDFPRLPGDRSPFMEVRDYLPGQVLYAPSIRDTNDLSLLGEIQRDRLTIELDDEGYVQQVNCR